MPLLIITPLQEELDFFLRGCQRLGHEARSLTLGRLTTSAIPALDITLAVGGCGKAQFAAQTQHLIERGPAWELVICAGAAGALADELNVGDVVVAMTTVEHDYRNKFTQTPLPSFDGHPAALAELRRVKDTHDLTHAFFGLVASGDEDVVDAERRAALQAETGALAVAWEGAGGARACRFSGVPYLELRGITDGADPDAPSHFEHNLELAMARLAALIVAWRSH